VNRPKLPLVDSRKSDQVDAGQRTANLLHLAASDEVSEVDGEEACVLEMSGSFLQEAFGEHDLNDFLHRLLASPVALKVACGRDPTDRRASG
jgi:hypothetical protein